MLIILLTVWQIAACFYVLFVCVMVLNAMSQMTRHAMRFAHLLLAAGAVAGVHSALVHPDLSSSLLSSGLALFLVCNERQKNANRPA